MQGKRNKKEGSKQENYKKYQYGIWEWTVYAVIGTVAMGMIGWVFYRNSAVVLLFAIIGLIYPEIKKRNLMEKRRNLLRLQFKDMLYYLSSSISAGKSVEQAFLQVNATLNNVYTGKKSDIVRESEMILNRLQINENIEEILKDFARRTDIEEIHHFADVFSVCKRSGGNLIEVIRTTSRMISERIEIKQEIESGLAGKKQEQKILSVAPVIMVVFISKMSGEFMEPLFMTETGRVVMTVALVLIGMGIWTSNRIMDIRI